MVMNLSRRATTDRVAGAVLSDRSPWGAPVYFIRIIIIAIIIIIIILTILILWLKISEIRSSSCIFHLESSSSSLSSSLSSSSSPSSFYDQKYQRSGHLKNSGDIFAQGLCQAQWSLIWPDLTFDNFFFNAVSGKRNWSCMDWSLLYSSGTWLIS